MTQLSIFDVKQKPYEPPCYTCTHGHRRGHFVICRIIKDGGYRHIGDKIVCKLYERIEDEKEDRVNA